MRALILVIGAAGLLAGCASKGPASVMGGECRIFERPEYAVRGKKPYDQDWIDSQVEGGVGGCNWKRPAARPASIDGPADVRQPPAPTKKRGIIRRIKDRVTGKTPAIEPVPYLPPVPVAQPAPPPPPPPRDRVDELLRPTEPRVVYPK
jgi:hypothetical protein